MKVVYKTLLKTKRKKRRMKTENKRMKMRKASF